jgi:hypothetical protein
MRRRSIIKGKDAKHSKQNGWYDGQRRQGSNEIRKINNAQENAKFRVAPGMKTLGSNMA